MEAFINGKNKNMLQGKKRKNMKRVPYKIGGFVKIVFATDETFDHKFIGRVGKIVHYDYSCGCGQSFPDDPMIGVKFNSKEIEEFWKEEIITLKGVLRV